MYKLVQVFSLTTKENNKRRIKIEIKVKRKGSKLKIER